MTWEISTNWACIIGIHVFNASQKNPEWYGAILKTNRNSEFYQFYLSLPLKPSQSHIVFQVIARKLWGKPMPHSFFPFYLAICLGLSHLVNDARLKGISCCNISSDWIYKMMMKGCLDGVRLTITTIYLITIFVKRLRPLVCAVLFGEYQVEEEKNSTVLYTVYRKVAQWCIQALLCCCIAPRHSHKSMSLLEFSVGCNWRAYYVHTVHEPFPTRLHVTMTSTTAILKHTSQSPTLVAFAAPWWKKLLGKSRWQFHHKDAGFF